MKKINKPFLFIAALVVIGGSAACFFAAANYLLREKNLILENEISQTASSTSEMIKVSSTTVKKLEHEIIDRDGQIKDLNKTIDQIEADLEMTAEERDDFQKKYKREKNRMDDFNSQIDDLLGSVGTLEKLEATDDELLQKYSKIYFLNENYIPESLAKIDPKYTVNQSEDYFFYAKVWPFLEEMMQDAEADDIDIEITSAYRSFAEQSSLKSAYTMVYGTGANQFSADQGYSEHQLGTAIDLTTSKTSSNFAAFEQTPADAWLIDNAYKYGFILSYPKNNGYYQYEPWHWRFVGRDLAKELHADGKNFYDLDQREIDEYQISFFD